MTKIHSKTLYILGIAALALILTVPRSSQAQTLMETEGAAGIGASMDSGPGTPGAASMRERINADIKIRNENIKNNQGIRNNKLENRMGMATTSTSTPPKGPPPGPGNGMGRDGDHNDQGNNGDNGNEHGTSLTNTGGENHPKIEMQRVRKDIFEMQKKHLIEQLNRALDNLTQVRGRIAERITKLESSGHTMTTAKNALVIADAKIAAAHIAVNALVSLTATSTGTTTASTSITVDLGKPRQIGAAAIKAVRDAQKALNAVVVAIAHSMGLKLDKDDRIVTPVGTTTATTTASTTP